MKSFKKAIAMLMSVLMLVMAVPLSDLGVQAANISASEFQTRLASVKSRFKDGEYFSGNYGTGVNLTKTSSKLLCTGTNNLGKTCTNTGYCAGGGWCTCNCGTYYYGGAARTYQCWAFACQVGYDIFGIDSYAGWQTHRNANNIQPGDIIRFSWNTGYAPHSIFVTNVVGDTIYYADANYTGPCKVEWDHSKTRSQIAALLNNRTDSEFRIYHAPNNATTTSTAPSVSYATITTGKYYIKNTSTGTYLNVDDGTDANTQNVSVASFTGGTSMQMEITSATNGYKIRPMCSSSRLVNPYADYVSSGVNVNIYNNVNDSSQWWGFEKVSGGYVIRNMQNQNCVLALSGSNVIVSTYTGAANQVWALEPYDTYTISYNANGGSGAPSSQTKVHGIATKLSSTKPTRTGYKFLGWSTSSSATSATYASGATYTANGNVTLYAVWEANTYTVTYNANGGTGASSSQTKTYGVNLTLYAKEPTRSGYTFLGWGTSASATSTTYAPGGTYTKNESVTLYAVWQKNTYTTYFDSNGGTNSTYAVRQAGENITFPTFEPYREYHVFLGWADSATSTTAQYTLGQTIKAGNGDKTFYAVWQAPIVMEDGCEYTVEFGEEEVEEYFMFTPEQSGYYIINAEKTSYYAEIYFYDNNKSGDISFHKLQYLEKGENYYLRCLCSVMNVEIGSATLSIEYTPITHMEAVTTRTVFPSMNTEYYWYEFSPLLAIYAGERIYFEGYSYDLSSELGLSVDSNLSSTTMWVEGIQSVKVCIGDLSCEMEVTVKESSVISLEGTGVNQLIENYHGSYWSSRNAFVYSLYYCDFECIATYDNGYTETLGYYDLNVINPQSEENIWGIGVHTVTIEYQGVSTEVEVEVIENPVQSVEVVSDPIVINESTYGIYFSGGNYWYNDVSKLLEENPIKLYVVYKDKTEEYIEITSYNSAELKRKGVTLNYSLSGVGANNYIKVSLWGNSVQLDVEMVENPELDIVVAGKVLEIPEHSSCYPIDTYYDCSGIKLELMMESGATEVVVLDYEKCCLSQYDCYYNASNLIKEGENEITIELMGITIPVTTVVATASIESFEFLTKPTNINAESAEVKLYFSDGTSKDIKVIRAYDRQGSEGDFMFLDWYTDIGIYFTARYQVAAVEHLELLYGIGGYSMALDDGYWTDLNNEEILGKTLAIASSVYFDKNTKFSGIQTSANINKIVMTTLLYFNFKYDATSTIEIDLDEMESQIRKIFAIDNIDLTKSIFFDADKNVIAVTEDWSLPYGLGHLFSDALQLYLEMDNSWVFEYTEGEDVTYVEIQKSTNQIVYIGDTYEFATPESVSVASEPQKTNYYVGDSLDISGLQLQLNYSDGTTEIITEGFTLSEFDPYQVGTQMIIVTYEGMSTNFNVLVEAPAITISSKEETLEIEGTVSLKAETTPSLQTIIWTSSNENVVTVMDGVVTAVAPGETVITAQFTYNGETYSQTCIVTVNEPLPTVTGLTVVTSPTKTTYIVGETLDTTGLSLRVDYDNDTSEIVTEGFTVSGYDASKVGVQTLEVMYADVITNLTVTISNPELILSDNERTMVIGGTVQLRAETSPSEQVVTWTSSDASVATVENGLVTGVNSGTSIVTVAFTYNGVTYSKECTITVIASLTSIEIATNPSKTVYKVGEELDNTDLSIQLNYDDGTTKVVTDGFTTDGYDAEKVGTQIITVYYHGHASMYTVQVEVDENAPQIVVESKKNVVGRTVTVDVILKNNPGIASARLTLDFDTSVLTLIDVTDAGKLGVQCHKAELTSPYTLSWMNDTATEDFDYNGTIVTLTFEIAEDAELGDYIIDLSYDYDNYDIWNVNVERVKFVVSDGVISVIDTIIGDVNADGVVNTLDRMTLARYLANWEAYTAVTIDLVAADVNGDGKVNTLDRMVLARHLADWSGYETLPCEM